MSNGPYPISLLNDIHRWFPDILYNPTRFRDVHDLLAYIRQVADVSPYTQGLQQYIAHQNHHVPVAPTPTTRYVPPSRATATSSSSPSTANRGTGNEYRRGPLESFLQPSTHTRSSTIPFPLSEFVRPSAEVTETTYEYTATSSMNGQPVTARIRTLPINVSAMENDDTEQTMTSILTQLLSPGNLRIFLEQNVEVSPTEQEIARASTLETPAAALEDNCAICQDTMEADQSLRRLNHCRHIFHKLCIDTWFHTNVHCPACRHDIRDASASAYELRHRHTTIHPATD